MQQVQVMLSPEIGMSVEEFVTAWNTSEKYHQLAQADVMDVQPRQFDSTQMAAIILTFMLGVGTGIVTDFAKDAIKDFVGQYLPKSQPPLPPLEVKVIKQADGTTMIIIAVKQ